MTAKIEEKIIIKEFNFAEDDTTEWLPVLDAYISVELLRGSKNVLEVGVWKGGWASTLLSNLEICYFGIDPYPGLTEIKHRTQMNFYNEPNFHLLENLRLFKEKFSNYKGRLDCVHIDGEHSEIAVHSELRFCSEYLIDSGLIIVDDFFDRRFPGVTNSTLKFINESDFCLFLITDQKAYLCHKSFHEIHISRLRTILEESNMNYSEGEAIGSFGESYFQSNSVNGYKNICLTKSNNQEILDEMLKKKIKEDKFKLKLKLIIPPIILIFYHSFRKITKLS